MFERVPWQRPGQQKKWPHTCSTLWNFPSCDFDWFCCCHVDVCFGWLGLFRVFVSDSSSNSPMSQSELINIKHKQIFIGITQGHPRKPCPPVPLLLALVPLQKFTIDLKNVQWKCPFHKFKDEIPGLSIDTWFCFQRDFPQLQTFYNDATLCPNLHVHVGSSFPFWGGQFSLLRTLLFIESFEERIDKPQKATSQKSTT